MSRIAIIGLVGRSLFFEVPRFHQGGETITAKSLHEEWGGKGFNQAVAAARQGAEVSFLGAVNAADVDALQTFCRREGVNALLCPKENSTATAAILTDGTGETRVTVYHGAELCARDVRGFLADIGRADYLLLNNEVPEEVNLAAVALAKRFGVKIIYNPAPARDLPGEILEAVAIFTPNEFELEQLRSCGVEKLRGCEIVTTLGRNGCRIEATGEIIPAPKVKAVDSTGAGDVFNAVLAVRLAEGLSLADACRDAVAAASESVTKKYVMPSLPRRRSSSLSEHSNGVCSNLQSSVFNFQSSDAVDTFGRHSNP